MKDYIVEMIDGGIIDVAYDSDYSLGCETCDYGSRYMNEFDIEMSDHRIHIEIIKDYGYAVTESFLMKYIIKNLEAIKNMTEKEFLEFLNDNFADSVRKDANIYKWSEFECIIEKI